MMFKLWMALRDMITSFKDFLKDRSERYMGRIANKGNVCILIMSDMNVKYSITRMKPSVRSP